MRTAESRLEGSIPENPPARSTIGVAQLHCNSGGDERGCGRDLSLKKPSCRRAIRPAFRSRRQFGSGDRLYLSGFLGRDINTGRIPEDPAAQVQLALDRMAQTLKAAGLDFRHMVFVNPYLTEKDADGSDEPDLCASISSSAIRRLAPPSRSRDCRTAQTSSSPAWRYWILSKRQAVRPKNMEPSPTASPCVFADDTLLLFGQIRVSFPE